MPRVTAIYRAAIKKLDFKKYLVELKDYSTNHVTFSIYFGTAGTTLKLEDTVPALKKASVDEENLNLTDLSSGHTKSISEADFLKNFPEFLL